MKKPIPRARAKNRGFTLIELMLVVAILSVLSSVLIPKVASIIDKAREGTARGSLTSFRSALKIYYADTEGSYPTDRDGLVPKYMDDIPAIAIPKPGNHARSNDVTNAEDDWATGAWIYDQNSGSLKINCTHVDLKGSVWSLY